MTTREWESADLLAERRPEEPDDKYVEDSLENLLQLPLDELLSSRTRHLPLDPLIEIPVTPTLPSAPLLHPIITTPSPTTRSNLPKPTKSPTQKLDSNSQPVSSPTNGHKRAASASMKPSTSLPTKLASFATPPIASPTLPKQARTKSPRPSNGFNTIPLPSPTARKLNPPIQLADFRNPSNQSPRTRTYTGNLNSPKLASSVSGKPSTKFNINQRPTRARSFSTPRLDSDSMSGPNPPWSTEEPLVYRIMGDENDPFGQKSRAAEREMGSDGRWEDRVIPTIARKIQADRLAKLEGERLINSWDIDGNPISTVPANKSPQSSTAPPPIQKSPTEEYPPAQSPTDPNSRMNYSYPTPPPSGVPPQIKNQNHIPPTDLEPPLRKELWESDGGPVSRFDTTDNERGRDDDGHEGGCCKCTIM